MLILRARNAYILILRAGGFQLGAGLLYIQLRIQTGMEQLQGQLQRFFIRDNGLVEDGLLGIQTAHLEIVERQLCLQNQLNVHDVSGAGLRVLAGCAHGTSHATPDVGLPSHIEAAGKSRCTGSRFQESRWRPVFRFAQPGYTRSSSSKNGK